MYRRSRGQRRAANGQRDTASVVVNVQKTFIVPLPVGATSNAIAINIWQVLLESNMFSAYRGMYDQVKMSGVSARIRGLNGSSALTLSNTPTIVTAWDRNGLESLANPPTVVSSGQQPFLSYQTVSSYSSAVVSNWSPGNAFRVNRYIYPSTISEKSYYCPTGALSVESLERNPAATFATQNGVDFKPILMIGAYAGFAGSVNQAIGLMIEFDITVSFRGLRRFSVTSDDAATQLASMAGTFLNGQSGELNTTNAQSAWTRVNNDGVIEGTGAPTSSEEIPTSPPVKTESGE